MPHAPVPIVPVRFEWGDDLDPVWNRSLPELALAANGVSLMMPHVEPYVVASIRAVADRLDAADAERAEAYCRQELAHQGQHARFNRRIVAHSPDLARVERVLGRVVNHLARRRSPEFSVGFAVGFEAIAYHAARWVSTHHRTLFTGADPVAESLFVWHLAEEVEHKAVAFDVGRAAGVSRRKVVGGTVTALVVLGVFAWSATLCQLRTERRLANPVAHLRLLRWTLGFLFDLLPELALLVVGDHHPDRLVDPSWYPMRLADIRSASAPPRTPAASPPSPR